MCLSHRKHSPDCSPCFLTGGLHSPDSRPHSTKLKGLCPSCPKGQCAVPPHNGPFISAPSSLCHNIKRFSPLGADSLLGLLRLWRNRRDRAVAAGRPTHPASDTRTQSQLQLAGDAHARLKDMLLGSPNRWIFIVGTHCYKLPKEKANKNIWLPSKTSCKKLCFC